MQEMTTKHTDHKDTHAHTCSHTGRSRRDLESTFSNNTVSCMCAAGKIRGCPSADGRLPNNFLSNCKSRVKILTPLVSPSCRWAARIDESVLSTVELNAGDFNSIPQNNVNLPSITTLRSVGPDVAGSPGSSFPGSPSSAVRERRTSVASVLRHRRSSATDADVKKALVSMRGGAAEEEAAEDDFENDSFQSTSDRILTSVGRFEQRVGRLEDLEACGVALRDAAGG